MGDDCSSGARNTAGNAQKPVVTAPQARGPGEPPGLPERAVAVVVHDGRLLVVRRTRAGRTPYAVLPGGGVEPGETPAEACLRELSEETGLAGHVVAALGTLEHADRIAHYLHVEPADPAVGLRIGGPEAARQSGADRHEPAWVGLDELDRIDLQPAEVRSLVMTWAARRPGPGH